jgi:hypothetical protein
MKKPRYRIDARCLALLAASLTTFVATCSTPRESTSETSGGSNVVAPTGPAITMSSLLEELTDREALARWPSPAYTCAQASSYDRKSIAPDKDWFANGDAGQYIRTEEHDGRTEGVMLDADGPGAIVRIWSANPAGTLRVYVDGDPHAAIEADMDAILSGEGEVKPPLSAETSRGHSLYAPIPYWSHCKITCDKPKDVYYQVNYRTYPADTRVESFAAGDYGRMASAMSIANDALHRGVTISDLGVFYGLASPARRSTARQEHAHAAGPAALRHLQCEIESPDIASALRLLLLHMRCDGEETVLCPLGDFFGSSPGLNKESSWPFQVTPLDSASHRDGDSNSTRAVLFSYWIMPYERDLELWLEDTGAPEADVSVRVAIEKWTWDDRSMHFHARWRGAHDLKTRPMIDWNHLTIEGQGVFVGDALSIGNPTTQWWGEGDEKFYVDGETFPSHFGTGTEDYYGYAWSSPQLFQHPLHNQTRCDGPNVFGWTSVNRFRALDAIPFTKSLRFDMEVWHWKECEIERAATVYYYARPGAKDNAPAIRAADLEIKTFEYKPFRVPGAIEAEGLRVVDSSAGLEHETQELDGERWSDGKQLFVKAKEKGAFIALSVPVSEPGRHEVIVYPTKSWDYGTLQFFVDGAKAGEPLVTFNTAGHDVAAPKPYSLGTFELGSEMTLRIEVVGTHEKSDAPHYYFGLDCVVIE